MENQKVERVIALTKLSDTPFHPTIADCHRWTEILNHIMFRGVVPKYRKISVRKMHKFAWCIGKTTPKRKKKYCELIIKDTFESFAAFYSVLAHELCHAAEYHEIGEINHGKFFYSHREMLAIIGIKLRSRY